MLDLSFWEITIIAVACIVFFKPEDIPGILRQAGKMTRKVKRTIHEFTSAFEEEESEHKVVKPRSKILGLDGKYHDAYDVNEVFEQKMNEIEIPAEHKAESKEKDNDPNGTAA